MRTKHKMKLVRNKRRAGFFQMTLLVNDQLGEAETGPVVDIRSAGSSATTKRQRRGSTSGLTSAADGFILC